MKLQKKITFALTMLTFLVMQSHAKNYKGAELRTKESFLYGRFEVRYKASAGSGHTSTFFTYNDTDPNQNWNEIDIEILGRYADDVQFNTITPGRRNHVHHQFVPFSPYNDFHTYTIEWTPDYVAWFIDGEQAHRQTGEHITTLKRPQKIMMNIWNPDNENWVGTWSDAVLPRFADYDYVSYASYTPGSGNIGTDNNFTLQWKDDFDTWNQSRWQKATHTFAGNLCDFTPDNAVFHDGLMTLCLTDPDILGYQDKYPPDILWARAGLDRVTVKFSEELDRTSAEHKSNYVITGAQIDGATLQDDLTTVELAVPNLDLSGNYNILAYRIKDNSPLKNAMLGKNVKITMPQPLSLPIKINVGGTAVNGYLGDQEWNYNVEYGYLDGQKANAEYNQPIANTTEDLIYRSERNGLAEYKVRLPNGHYKVTLMMAENYFNEAAKRMFDVTMEGEKVAGGLDLFALAGIHTAYNMVQNNVKISDNILDIHFAADVDFALLNGIIIESVNTGVGPTSSFLPNQFQLSPNYPNPFNASTSISYFLPDDASVKLAVFDILGNQIQQLVNQYQFPGEHKIVWNPNRASGIYFCKLDIQHGDEKRSATQKMLLLK